jgi:hypothetical protein
VKPVKLFTPGQITAACFLGSPALAASLFGINELRFGRRDRAAWVAAAGLALTTLIYAYWIVWHPIGMLSWTAHMALTAVTEKLAERYQGPEVKARLSVDAQRRSNWSLLAMWVAELALILSIVLPIQRRRFEQEHPSVRVGQGRIYYQPPVTPAEAEQVGRYFERDVSGGLVAFRLQLERFREGYALSFSPGPVLLDERQMRILGDLVSQQVFEGRPVATRQCKERDFSDCLF